MPRPLQVQRQQPRQDLVVGQVSGPPVRGEHGRVERPMRQVEPGQPRVVEVGERACEIFKVAATCGWPKTSKIWGGFTGR
jgi:hypothetical protein